MTDMHTGMYERLAAEGVQVEGRLDFDRLFDALGAALRLTYGAEGVVRAAPAAGEAGVRKGA
ncbi:MAG: hypothetical protein HFH27_12045 [Clostridiaceae bacterium]|nr:hypothetical protein [Clostridiaceae bacterium]MCI9485170.1 hypothetical protein [Clostridiaceae bacterium]